MPRTDDHEPMNWRATCPSPCVPALEKWPPCGLSCEGRAQCERERAEYDERMGEQEEEEAAS